MNLWGSARPFLFLLVGGAASMTAGCGAPVAVAGESYAADGTLLATSSKTSSDHFVSMVSKKDCAFWRAFQGQPICKEREGDTDPYDVDYTHSERTVAEDGVHYVPPLRPAANAPATSWDAAAYAEATTAPPQMKAVAASSNDAIAPARVKKASPAKKTKIKSSHKKKAKKPSQDQAATGSGAGRPRGCRAP